jgi:diguanylate cyclase (GGDEF)-like protein
MLEAALPPNEAQRLHSVRNLKVLDSSPEERYDRISRLATRLFGVPVALVSLVDQDRQWFKTRQGTDLRQTPRRVSFCAHAILGEAPLVVTDCREDSRFADNPLVVGDPGIRSYAGHPVHAPDGSRVGTLCLIDSQPRSYSADDLALLADLAAMVDRELALTALSSTDEVTRLSNRRGFKMLAEPVLALCYRQQEVACLALFHIRGLKRTAATQGQSAEEDGLRRFATTLLEHFRASDVIARVSEEHFAVLASVCTQPQMQASLARLEQRMADSHLREAHPAMRWDVTVLGFDPAYALDLEILLQTAFQQLPPV